MPQQSSVRNPTSRVYPSPASARPSIARVCRAGAVLVALLGLLVTPSWAGDSPWNRATLRGLPGMAVIVEALTPEVERTGLTRNQLQTDVELRLRQAGIRVLTSEERFAVVGKPYLSVRVTILLYGERLVIYHIKVELVQYASLETGEVAFAAATWDTARLGTLDISNLSYGRDRVIDEVDEFINAYLSVNPRPAGNPPPAQATPSPAAKPKQRTR
jgi:hypothetical protein